MVGCNLNIINMSSETQEQDSFDWMASNMQEAKAALDAISKLNANADPEDRLEKIYEAYALLMETNDELMRTKAQIRKAFKIVEKDVKAYMATSEEETKED